MNSQAIAPDHTDVQLEADLRLLPQVVDAVKAAGTVLLERFTPAARPRNLADLLHAIQENDEASKAILRPKLLALRPESQWVEDEEEGGPLPAGEWWIVDAAEGNVNHIHGMTEWAVTATLVRNNTPMLTVVHLPLTDTLYTALAGGGAYEDGIRLQVSSKSALEAALVGTGQARPGEDKETVRRMAESIAAMLGSALLVRASVPATLTMTHIAAGRMDGFWQYSQVRSGLLPGALLIAEAGGRVTDTHGEAWGLNSKDLLAAAPGVHAGMVRVLAAIR